MQQVAPYGVGTRFGVEYGDSGRHQPVLSMRSVCGDPALLAGFRPDSTDSSDRFLLRLPVPGLGLSVPFEANAFYKLLVGTIAEIQFHKDRTFIVDL